jgi:hypothetical protein
MIASHLLDETRMVHSKGNIVIHKAILSAVLATSVLTISSYGEGGRAVSGPAGGGAKTVTNGASNSAPAPANNGASNNTQAPANSGAANNAQAPANANTNSQNTPNNTSNSRSGQNTANQPNANGTNSNNGDTKKDARTDEGRNDPDAQRDAARRGQQQNNPQQQNIPTVIGVPGYGSVNWYGNYSYPYWNGWQSYGNNNNGYYNNNNNANRSSDANPNSVNNTVSSDRPTAGANATAGRERIEQQVESSGTYAMAVRELNEAQANYDAVLGKLRSGLKGSSEYREAADSKKAASRQVDAVQSKFSEVATTTAPSTQPIPQSLVKAAQTKLDAASELSQIEKDQAEKDPQVRAARARLDAALARVAAMKSPPQTVITPTK